MNKIDILDALDETAALCSRDPNIERNADGEVHGCIGLSAQQGPGIGFIGMLQLLNDYRAIMTTVHGWVTTIARSKPASVHAYLVLNVQCAMSVLMQQGEWLLEVQTSRRNYRST